MYTLNNADITNLKEAELGPLHDMALRTAGNDDDMRMRRAKADAEEHEIEIGEEEEKGTNERVIRHVVYDTKHFLVEEGDVDVDVVGDGERLTHGKNYQLPSEQRLRTAIPHYWDDLPSGGISNVVSTRRAHMSLRCCQPTAELSRRVSPGKTTLLRMLFAA